VLQILPDLYIESDLPAVYHRGIGAFVVSDVHIGFEEEMQRKKVYLPNVQKKRFLRVYNKCREVFKADKIIIDGDMKHIFERLGSQEREDLREIFTILKEDGVEVKLIKGNHDNYIGAVAEKFDNIELLEELWVGNILFTHGHKPFQLDSNKVAVIGHEHPRISLRDRLGFNRKFQCFLDVPLKGGGRTLVLPSVGSYQAGNDISLVHNNFLSPTLRNLGILEEAKPYVVIENQGIMEFPTMGAIKDIL
jgi:putative phosphoesterase, SbcD/Mre11-related